MFVAHVSDLILSDVPHLNVMEFERKVVAYERENTICENASEIENESGRENTICENASERENSSKLETCENAPQGMVSSLIDWWNSGGGESTKVKTSL